MNRSVLERQMFKKGGAVFPDLSGDGQVTRKDILMGRGVLPMQEGGMVPVAMGAPEAPAGLPAAVGAPGPEQIDPAMMEQMLQQAATQFADVEQAGDYEEMMNAIRGDQQSIGQRRQELASLVGEEDAQETPESVLTLLQPVMQLAAIDQGIGGLAEEAMGSGAVEGPMAGGIMSTVNMGGEEAPMPMEGGEPVQAFRNGGVVRMANGGSPLMPASFGMPTGMIPQRPALPEIPGLQQGVQDRLALYKEMGLQASDPTADIEEQRRLSQAQALFDIAGTAFAFAGPGSRTMSPAERLAEATQQTQLFDRLGGRAQQFSEFKRGREKEGREFERGLKLTALQGAETERGKALERRAGAEAQERQATFDFARDLMRQDFTQKENETQRDYGARLATQAIEAQERLQRIRGSQSQEDIQLRGTLQRGLAELQGRIAADAQQRTFDFTASQAGLDRDFKESMQNRLFDNERELQVLRGAQSLEQIGATGQEQRKTAEARAALEEEQIKLRYGLDLSNQLELITAREESGLRTMEQQHEYNLELQEEGGDLAELMARQERAHNMYMRRLDREFSSGEARTRRQFEREMAEDAREAGLSEREIDRRMSVYNNTLDFLLQERGLDQVDTRLAMQAAQIAHGSQMDVLSGFAARANRLGDDSKARTIRYLSDPQVLGQYATGQLGDQTAEFEQLILDYTKPEPYWDGQQYTMRPGGQLNSQLVAAIEARKQSGLSVPQMGYSGMQEGGAIMGAGADMLRENRGALAGASSDLDLSYATGPGSFGAFIANAITKIADYTIAPQSAEAIDAVSALNTDTLLGILDSRGQKSNLDMQREVKKLFPDPGALGTDEQALNKTRALIGMLNDDIANLQVKVEERLLPAASLSKVKEDIRRLTSYRDQYQRLLGALEKRMAPREEIGSELDAFFKSRM